MNIPKEPSRQQIIVIGTGISRVATAHMVSTIIKHNQEIVVLEQAEESIGGLEGLALNRNGPIEGVLVVHQEGNSDLFIGQPYYEQYRPRLQKYNRRK